ncbi:DUF3160 domain-containing protein [bacterium]|nr:DUF3160 domain-containing protein [bacterium]
MRNYLLLLLVAALLTLLVGCRQQATTSAVQTQAAAGATPAAAAEGTGGYQFTSANSFSVPLGDQPAFAPRVQPYTVEPGLKNVANLAHFKSDLAPEHMQMIAKNGFVVLPANWKQMEFVYELNNYPKEHRPSFVTTDSVLHTMHVFYDYMLRTMEVTKLYERAEKLSVGLLQATTKKLSENLPPELKEAARLNVAFALVPVKLLGVPQNQWGVTVPEDIARIAEGEMVLMAQHEGFKRSPVTDFDVDYSQFVPRGHYTRSDKLKRYFKALMWYGLVALPLYDLQKTPNLQPRQARQAYLLAQHIVYGSYDGEPLGKIWEDIYEPTAFMVGFADDNTPEDFIKAGQGLWSDAKDAAKLIPEQNIVALAQKLLALRPAEIIAVSITGLTKLPGNPQLRLMGQRYILDSYLFQQMVYPYVGKSDDPNHPGTHNMRTFPMGLDVMSILGSERAYAIADTVYGQTKFVNYDKQTKVLRGKVAAYQDADWSKTVYNGWLHTLKLLLEPKTEGYPAFMGKEAWLDKQLNCALASWSELRHDTILYAKQSVVAECGGEGGERKPPPKPKGYVEPEVLTYWRAGLLLTQLRDGLKARKLLGTDEDDTLSNKFDDFIALLNSLQGISVKELQNQPLTQEEFNLIEFYGDNIAHLNLFTTFSEESSEITSSADQDMAVVADVHTGPIGAESYALEEGVGRAAEIYVVYPMQGKLMIGRGAVFSYYEFTVPVANRMTDEDWQKKLDSSDRPKVPAWVKSFRSSLGAKGKRDVEEKGVPTFSTGGC